MSDNTFTTQNGLFKNSYASKISNLIPDFVYLAREAKDVPTGEQPGGDHKQPVVVTSPQGVTLAAAEAGPFALNSPIAGSTKQATVSGSQFLLREALDYESIFRSTNQNAFERVTQHVIKNMTKVTYNYMESLMLWGQSGIGTVSAVSGTGNVTATITTAEWAPGLWWFSEGRKCLFTNAAGTVTRGSASVSDYSLTGRTVTFDTDLTALGVVATDAIWMSTAGSGGEMVGLMKIAANTTGSLFGINSTTYNAWRPGAAYGAGSAPLAFTQTMKALEEAAARGLGDEITESDLIVNPKSWMSLNIDAAANRRTDSSYKGSKFEGGHEVLEYYSVYGTVRVISHKMMKEGYALILPKCSQSIKKIGAMTTPTFALPGFTEKNAQYLRPMENNAGVETRMYWNSAAFTEYVSQLKIISGIVNS